MQNRIIDAFARSAISCVALVDDAFDAPSIDAEEMGTLNDLIDTLNAGDLVPGIFISQENLDSVRDALARSEYDSDPVVDTVDKLFRAYVQTGDPAFDPNGVFQRVKASNLLYVRPLIDLLKKTNPLLNIVQCGSRASDMDAAAKSAQLIFMDFFLMTGLPADGEPNVDEKAAARTASIERLRNLIAAVDDPNQTPSIILMSSHDIEDRVDAFRDEMIKSQGRVFASRFDFIHKKQITSGAGGMVEIDWPAADSLLNIIQSYAFGMALHTALNQWKAGATQAVEATWIQIREMRLKDFAYLARFRLAKEGITLSEYLDWLFSETLSDAIGRHVDWQHEVFSVIDKQDGPSSAIKGAFDGPTSAIAEMYDRVRIEKPKQRERRNYRIGDLYKSQKDAKRICAIITPDCDLVARKSGMKAKRLLVVYGTLREIHEPEASFADFISIGGTPFNIEWDPKDVQTVELDKWPKPGAKRGAFKYIGTLRPIYAEELRGRVINDLARVGVNVAPVMGSNRAAKAIISGNIADIEIDLAPGRSACSVLYGRGGKDQSHAIFFETVIFNFIEALRKIDSADLPEAHQKNLLDITTKPSVQVVLFNKLCDAGVPIVDGKAGSISVGSKVLGRGAKDRPWCQLVVTPPTEH